MYRIGTKLLSTLDITYTVYRIGTKLLNTLDITYTVYLIGTKTTEYIRGTKCTTIL